VIETLRAEVYIFTTGTLYKISSRALLPSPLRTGNFTVECPCPEPFRTQQHLTIVDLPGLIHSENKLQSSADVALVLSIVQSYMANRRSIILAVVLAKNDYANQIVTKLQPWCAA
jgi:hypothetical protein